MYDLGTGDEVEHMALRIGAMMPPLSGASHWFGGEIDRTALSGNPVLVHFWSIGCSACKDQMPVVHRLVQRYATQGLQCIAVHVPRTEQERDVDELKRAIEDLGMHEPSAVDNHHVITRRFENQYLPAYFLFDDKGKMRARAAGTQGATIIRTALERMFTTTV